MPDSTIINTVNLYLKQIPESFGLKISYLFGYYSNGTSNENSDIDVAIILENENDFYTNQMLLMKWRRKIDLRIEPHPIKEIDFNNDNPFANEIKKTGILMSF